jgi:hypothetical protein
MAQESFWIQGYADREALDDFDPVARKILRGQKRKSIASTSWKPDDFSLEREGISPEIDSDGHRLS